MQIQTFDGFSSGKDRLIPIPASAFRDLFPLIDDLAEIQVTLFALYAIQQKEGRYKFLRRADFLDSIPLLAALSTYSPGSAPDSVLDAALARAAARATLLPAQIHLAHAAETLYFINSDDGREGQRLALAGSWQPSQFGTTVEILPERPNIYQLYERAFGLTLTPMLRDELRDAASEYPYEWIAEAFRLALLEDVRKWRYVLAILERWRKEGKQSEKSPRVPAGGADDNANKYAAFIRSRPEHGSPYDDDGS